MTIQKKRAETENSLISIQQARLGYAKQRCFNHRHSAPQLFLPRYRTGRSISITTHKKYFYTYNNPGT
ncbi:hypothetical protein FHS16_003260 [Paenibacillus endophyticus]|uniref:Uncharacterized protein n=1 Tax=Paenibacillus endophyticus TaxID=1294268 RepID=A0A7W5C8Q3_9BACL|nr:hypothetical protein [Paenibacillus endophyticus]